MRNPKLFDAVRAGRGVMGEIADAMLDGTLCGCCGEYLGMDLGFPGYCAGCGDQFDYPVMTPKGLTVDPKPTRYSPETKVEKPFTCQVEGCGKRFRSKKAKRAHRRDAHGCVNA